MALQGEGLCFFSSRRRRTSCGRDWSSDVCSSDLGRQTAAYLTETPGGWNLLGRTSARLFDREREGFSLLRVGDQVRFVSVSRETFEREGGKSKPMKSEERRVGKECRYRWWMKDER